MVKAMMVWRTGEIWLPGVSVWFVHVVKVLCLVETTC